MQDAGTRTLTAHAVSGNNLGRCVQLSTAACWHIKTWGQKLTLLNLDARPRGVASFMRGTLYSDERAPRDWMDPKADLDALENKTLSPPGFELKFLCCPAHDPVTPLGIQY